jgi:hypothetical protein
MERRQRLEERAKRTSPPRGARRGGGWCEGEHRGGGRPLSDGQVDRRLSTRHGRVSDAIIELQAANKPRRLIRRTDICLRVTTRPTFRVKACAKEPFTIDGPGHLAAATCSGIGANVARIRWWRPNSPAGARAYSPSSRATPSRGALREHRAQRRRAADHADAAGVSGRTAMSVFHLRDPQPGGSAACST